MVSINRPCGVVVSAQQSCKALERRTLVADLMQDVEQIAGRARQPIEPHDHERVALIECRQRLAQHRAIRTRARQLLGKRPARPGRFKLDDLVMHRLAVCAVPGIANYRAHVPLFRISFSHKRNGVLPRTLQVCASPH
jgi:hypothetical protein